MSELKNQKIDERNIQTLKYALMKRSIVPEDLERAPHITELLSRAKGGLPEVLSSIRFSQDPIIADFLAVYDKATKPDQEVMPWEGFCLAAKLDPNALLGAVLLALQNVSADTVKVMLFTHHPDTVKARIRNAKKSAGHKDRDAIDTAVGLLPSPKGPTFIRKIVVNEHPEASEERESPEEADLDFVFPPLSETQQTINRPRLAAPKE